MPHVTGVEVSYILRTGRSETGQTVTEAHKKGPTFQPSLETTPEACRADSVEKVKLPSYPSMDQPPISQVRAPRCAPICLPSWVIGRIDPKGLAVILTLQAYGASVEWVELELKQISENSLVPKGALPMLFKKLADDGLIETGKSFNEETGKARYFFRLHIWDLDFND